MASSSRAMRLFKALKVYAKESSNNFDSRVVLNKIKLSSNSVDGIIGTFTVDNTMCNGGGTMHGGYIASVIDVMSFFTLLGKPNGKVSWTTDVHINFFKASKIGDKITAETNILKNGDTSVVEACLFDNGGTMLAKGLVSYKSGSEKFQRLGKDIYKFDVNEIN